MTPENSEKLGLIADRVANLSAALQMPLPDRMHVNQMRASLLEIQAELRAIVVAETGENPWEGEPQ
jgi:hypothetical protein